MAPRKRVNFKPPPDGLGKGREIMQRIGTVPLILKEHILCKEID
jgi:hypothetical protein